MGDNVNDDVKNDVDDKNVNIDDVSDATKKIQQNKETVETFNAEAERKKIREKLKAEFEKEYAEKERISKLSADEKEELEKQQKEKKIADLEAEIIRRDLKDRAIIDLSKSGYPSELSSLLDYSGEDSFKQSLNQLKTTFESALKKAVNEKLKGKTPEQLHDTDTNSIRDMIASNIKGGF